jgi:hypothetical protein
VREQRNWTTVGAELVERCGGRDAVLCEILALDWDEIPEDGHLSVGMMPGMAIKEAILQLEIPRVRKIAVGGMSVPDADGGDGFYPGLYGIEGNYTAGRACIFILDTGVEVTPVASFFYPKAASAAA